MARHVAQRFLNDAINVDGRLGREKSVRKLPPVMHLHARLARELFREPLQRLLQAEIIQDGGTKNLGLVAHALQGIFHNLFDRAHVLHKDGVGFRGFLRPRAPA